MVIVIECISYNYTSWADCISVLQKRFPAISARALAALRSCEEHDQAGPFCIQAAVEAGRRCEEAGWDARPAWQDLNNGLRPPEPDRNDSCLGEWAHGWQFHASNAMENAEFDALLVTLALPSTRSNAASAGKARLHSCRGPFASTWLTVCPTTEQLRLKNSLLCCAVRRRLGLAVNFQGPDAHGYRRLADNTGARLNVRLAALIAAWRQVFIEAGGQVPDRNIERMLRNSYVPVSPDGSRRLDLIVPGLNVDRGRPLFCDATVLSPLGRAGGPRGGTSNRGGRLLHAATVDNSNHYHEVTDTGLGSLYCLGCEVYGRWSEQCITLVPALAREHARGLHIRIRRGAALGFQYRWWGILNIALQRSVAEAVLRDTGQDLCTIEFEAVPPLADLPVID